MIIFWIVFATILFGGLHSCRQGWTANTRLGYCYKHFHGDIKMTWLDAVYFCTKEESELAFLEDVNETEFVKDLFLAYFNAENVWICGMYNEWRESSRNCTADDDFTNGSWGNYFSNNHCPQIRRQYFTYGYSHYGSCDDRLPFICKALDVEKESSTTTVTETSTLHTTVTTTVTTTVPQEKEMSQQKTQNEPTKDVRVPILATLLACFMVFSIVILVLFVRQRRSMPSTQTLYETPQPNQFRDEHAYQSINGHISGTSNGIYDHPTTIAEDRVYYVNNNEHGRTVYSPNSAYVDVRTPDDMGMSTSSNNT